MNQNLIELLVYIRGNQTVRRMFCCCPGGFQNVLVFTKEPFPETVETLLSGQVERNQMQPISRFDSDERLV